MLLAIRICVISCILLLLAICITGCATGSRQTQNTGNAGSGRVAEKGPKHVTRPEPPTGTAPQFKTAAVSCASTGLNWSYHGGKLLEHAQIQVVFWGSQWSAQDRNITTDKITRMVNSQYLTHIYQTVGCPSLLQFYWDNQVTPAPGASVDDEVLRLIEAGSVISPASNPDNAYLLLAPGVGYADGAYGWHNWMRLTTSSPYIHYGVVDNYDLDQVTQTFSHELVETMSDPRFGGFYGDNDGACGQQPCENGDACYCFTTILGDVAVTYYHGATDAAGVAPNGIGGCQVGGTPPCKTCEQLGAECGQVDDGCGHMLQCGSCNPPNTCGGGGQPNKCGCIPSKENPCK
jgi:hypothetical protein